MGVMCRGHFIRLVECAAVNALPKNGYLESPRRAYALTTSCFPAFALARFGFAGDNGSPNLSRLPMVAVYLASASHNMRVQAETLPGVSGGSIGCLVLHDTGLNSRRDKVR